MAIMYLHPNSTIEDGAGGNPYTAIDDGVTKPTVPTATPVNTETVQNTDKNDKDDTQSYGTQNTTAVTGGYINDVRLWLYQALGATSGDEYIDYDLRISNVWKGTPQSVGSDGSWKYWEWDTAVANISLNSILTNNGFRFVSPGLSNGDNTQAFSGAYLVIDYSIASGTILPFIQAHQRIEDNTEEF